MPEAEGAGGSTGRRTLSDLATSALQRLDGYRQPATRRGRVITGVGALVLFGFVVYLAAKSLPTLTDPNPWLVLVLIFVTTPMIAALNAVEFQLIGRTVGQDYSFMAAARVTILGSITNFLPAPGSFVVRTGSLSKRGVDLKAATASNLVASALWLGLTAVVAGVALATSGAPGFGLTTFGIGAAVSVSSAVKISRSMTGAGRGSPAGTVRSLLVVELAMIAIGSARTWIAFRTLGTTISAADAVIIGTSQVIATMIGVFPAGLGIRELLAAALGTTVGVDGALTIAATAVDRAASQVGFLVIGIVFLATGKIASGDLFARLRMRRIPSNQDEEAPAVSERP